jgi:cytochrome c
MRNSFWILVVLPAVALLWSCGPSVRAGSIVAGGDATRGLASISRYGCGSCHTIYGISSAHGLVGPPLTGLRNRMYVAGMLPNTPDNLMHWIREPKAVNPKTAMPQLGVTERDAADIAAYIYSNP